MKRKDLIRELEQLGCVLYRHGGRHDIYINTATGQKSPIPRHNEVKDSLCRLIRKQLGLS
jgi:mRNA interferase HicA